MFNVGRLNLFGSLGGALVGGKRLLPPKELGLVAGQLYFALDAGFSVNRGISAIKHRGRLARLMPDIERGVQSGESLCAALRKTGAFPDFFTEMARVGEESGMLAEIMRQLSDYYDREARVADELRSAMVYPLMVSAMMAGVITAAMLLVIPGYARIFEANGAALPAATSALIAASGFVSRRGNMLAAGVFIAAAALRHLTSSGAGIMLKHRLFLLSGAYTKSVNARFANALRLMLASGGGLVESVLTAKNVAGNRAMDSRLQAAAERVTRGMTLGQALDGVKGIDKMLITMIKLGEETGQLPLTVARCSDHLQREVDKQTASLSRLVEPVITLVLGAVLAFIMLAIMLPTFQMAEIL